jgi:hypothetical protein
MEWEDYTQQLSGSAENSRLVYNFYKELLYLDIIVFNIKRMYLGTIFFAMVCIDAHPIHNKSYR